MHQLLSPGAILLLAAAPVAQISAAMSVPTPIVVSCVEPGQTQTATQPSGPSNNFQQFVFTQNTHAAIGGWATSDALSARFSISLVASINALAPSGSSASIGATSVLVFVSCPTPTPVRWVAPFLNASAPGLAQPVISVDLGDDGSIDFINGNLWSLSQPQVIGPQPLPVRLTFSALHQQPGTISVGQEVMALPYTNVLSTTAAIGCTNGGSYITATPSFLDQGVRLAAASSLPTTPWVALVIGWQTQPLLLPSAGQAPCLLVPSPDLVLLQGFQIPPIDVPLPPAVRPATFWIQGVIPDAQLLTTDCLRIDAT